MADQHTKTGNILIVDDNEDVLKAAKVYLKRHFTRVDTETDPQHIPQHLTRENYDAVLLDMNFNNNEEGSGKEGFYWLDTILKTDPSMAVVLITAYGDVDVAVKAIKEGASDFVMKPWNNEKLLATLQSAVNLKRSREEIKTLKNQQQHLQEENEQKFREIIGESPAMQKVFAEIENVAGTDANVLILGENGTGKELVARALHRYSNRSEAIFTNVDLGAINENLFESELFGHVKGAFTDARGDRPGRFEIAHGGTLFMDEIGNLSLPMQAKLLTVLQNRKITRVGSNKEQAIDIRLICATNRDLQAMVENKDFRQDLLFRINTIEINLPPLRERTEDIPLLADYFLKVYSGKYNRNIHSISPAALKRMEKYTWPGNVRELQHAMERAIIMCKGSVLQPQDFYFSRTTDKKSSKKDITLDDYNLEEVEKALIKKALKKHEGNITHTAQELGLSRASLYRRLEKYGL